MDDIMGQVSKAFEERRRELQAELDDIEAKEAAVRKALSAEASSTDRKPSIPDDKYQEVLSYLRQHPESRQADIAKDLKLNSGIISSAMKIALNRRDAEVDKAGRGARYTAVKHK